MSIIEATVRNFFVNSGIVLNGSRSWDIKINKRGFYKKVFSRKSLGFGESYVDGDWDCANLPQLFHMLALAKEEKSKSYRSNVIYKLKSRLLNLQNRRRSLEVAQHYNLSNKMYENMLDDLHMQYSCAYYDDGATTLGEAQSDKLDMICRKLCLEPGQRVLEIGGGWGGLAKYMAENYGVNVVSVNISDEQIKYARNLCNKLPVDIVYKDYRDIGSLGQFDRVVSVAMFEAVGHRNFRMYMEKACGALKNNGIFLLHTIGGNITRAHPDLWILNYVFPNGYIPSLHQIGTVSEGLFVVEDLHNLSLNYEKTLVEWRIRFNKNWLNIKKLDTKFDQRFYRLWNYYLSCCAGAFRSRNLQLWQIVFTKYKSGTEVSQEALRGMRTNRMDQTQI